MYRERDGCKMKNSRPSKIRKTRVRWAVRKEFGRYDRDGCCGRQPARADVAGLPSRCMAGTDGNRAHTDAGCKCNAKNEVRAK